MREYLESLGGTARSMLRDTTNDESAATYMAEPKGKGKGNGKVPAPTAVPLPANGPSSAAASTAAAAAATCPTCFAELTVDLTAAPTAAAAAAAVPLRRKGILSRIPASRVGSAFQSSTKIEALLEDLWRAQVEEPGCKAIVFSQFVSMLDLIQHRLASAGVRCVKMDGGMTVAARDRVITAFREDPDVSVFLISLKAGGVALNLTAASRIYLMDPW
jgi:DNA repair protein RAD16